MMTSAQHIIATQTMVSSSYELREAPDEMNQENDQKLCELRALLEEERAKNERAMRCIVDLQSALRQALQENEDQEQDMKELLQTCEQIHEEKMDLLKKCSTNHISTHTPGRSSPNNVNVVEREAQPVIGHTHHMQCKAQRKRVIVSMNSLVEKLLQEQKEEQTQAMTEMKEKMSHEQELKKQAYQNVIKDLISKNVLLMLEEGKTKNQVGTAQGSRSRSSITSMIKKSSTRPTTGNRSTSDPCVLMEVNCDAHDDGISAVSAVSSNGSRGQTKRTSHPTSTMYADNGNQGEERTLNGNSGTSKINHDRNFQHKKGSVQTTGTTGVGGAASENKTVSPSADKNKTKRDQDRHLSGPLLRRSERRLLQRRMSDYLMTEESDSETEEAAPSSHHSQYDDDESESDDENDVLCSSALKSLKEAARQLSGKEPRGAVSNCDGIVKKVTARSDIAFGSADAGGHGDPQQLRRRERLHKRRSMIELCTDHQQQEMVELEQEAEPALRQYYAGITSTHNLSLSRCSRGIAIGRGGKTTEKRRSSTSRLELHCDSSPFQLIEDTLVDARLILSSANDKSQETRKEHKYVNECASNAKEADHNTNRLALPFADRVKFTKSKKKEKRGGLKAVLSSFKQETK
jgi:hypothetical protein